MKSWYPIGNVAVLATASVLLIACGGDGGGGGGGPLPNRVPTAAFTAAPAKGPVPLAIAVDGSASHDPDGSVAGYQWAFGDGATATGVTAVHTYTKPGRFLVRLTVTDDDAATDSADHAVVSMSLVAATSYEVKEIPSLGGYVLPSRINDSGQVAGYSYVGSGSSAHAFLYSDGTTRDLGTLGGSSSYGADINDSGDVVGHSLTATGAELAFRYHNGLMQELPTLGGSRSRAYAINTAATIVGQSIDSNGDYRGFIYRSGQVSAVDTLGGNYGDANAVNDEGHVAGRSTVTAGVMHAYLLQGATMVDLATGTTGLDFFVNALNDADDVVGLWQPGAGRDPTGFLYRDGVPALRRGRTRWAWSSSGRY